MDCMKAEMRSLFAKVEMLENNAIGEMQNLASGRQIKNFKEILALKEQKLQKLSFAINNMKD